MPLNTSMPSELLVAMTSIDCGTGDSLADISSIDASCNNQSMVVMEANINEALVINDNNVQYVVNGSPVSKVSHLKMFITLKNLLLCKFKSFYILS